MELKEGMYVSTVDRKEIGRITHFCDCEYCKERGYLEPVIDNPNIFITLIDMDNKFHGYKFYDNVLDLIQQGDYVNGYIVLGFVYDDEKSRKEGIDEKIGVIVGTYWCNCTVTYYIDQIKTVLTKEQFDVMAYEVKK